jgi:hypothetical protein
LSKGPTTELFEVDSAKPRISGDLEHFPKPEFSLDSNGQRFESFQLSNGSRDLMMQLHAAQCPRQTNQSRPSTDWELVDSQP